MQTNRAFLTTGWLARRSSSEEGLSDTHRAVYTSLTISPPDANRSAGGGVALGLGRGALARRALDSAPGGCTPDLRRHSRAVTQTTSDEPSRGPFIPAESPVDPDASRIGTRVHSFGSGARYAVVPTCTPDAKARHRLWRSASDPLVRMLSLRQCAVYRGLATAPFVRTVTRATAPSGDGRLGLPRYSGTMFTRSDVSRKPDRRGGEE